MVDDGRTDGRRTDDGRTTDGRTTEHGYTISSPCEPDGSGELINRYTLAYLFCYIKVGFKGVYITRTCFPDDLS